MQRQGQGAAAMRTASTSNRGARIAGRAAGRRAGRRAGVGGPQLLTPLPEVQVLALPLPPHPPPHQRATAVGRIRLVGVVAWAWGPPPQAVLGVGMRGLPSMWTCACCRARPAVTCSCMIRKGCCCCGRGCTAGGQCGGCSRGQVGVVLGRRARGGQVGGMLGRRARGGQVGGVLGRAGGRSGGAGRARER